MNSLFSTGLYALLTGDATLAALIGTRLYPAGALPQDPTLPFVVFQQVAGTHGTREAGPDGNAQTRVQFTTVASSHSSRCAVMQALRSKLHFYDGTLTGGVVVRHTEPETEFEQYEPPTDDSALGDFTGVQDFLFTHAE